MRTVSEGDWNFVHIETMYYKCFLCCVCLLTRKVSNNVFMNFNACEDIFSLLHSKWVQNLYIAFKKVIWRKKLEGPMM